ncbi:MAG TPA: hypothetical protein ENG92_01990 [Thiolapillus brandeum]|uniref:Uncharacterized protein n=1 Tax=Thiolapillus brandeum TaxID=1076588 RepID=A0A831K325_9GAMM|nr:hypothetical protein [Thiolapillus brandeum]
MITLLQFILFGFMKKSPGAIFHGNPEGVRRMDAPNNDLPSHFYRSSLIHSDSYGSAGDQPTCLGKFSINPESFMKHVG